MLLILSIFGLVLILTTGCSLRGEVSPLLVQEKAAIGINAHQPYVVAYNNLEDEVDTEPSFGCGWEAWTDYLNNNLQYPKDEALKTTQHVVYVAFTVDKSGFVHNAKVRSMAPLAYKTEALRLVNESPRWEPAMKDNRPMDAEYFVTVNF